MCLNDIRRYFFSVTMESMVYYCIWCYVTKLIPNLNFIIIYSQVYIKYKNISVSNMIDIYALFNWTLHSFFPLPFQSQKYGESAPLDATSKHLRKYIKTETVVSCYLKI